MTACCKEFEGVVGCIAVTFIFESNDETNLRHYNPRQRSALAIRFASHEYRPEIGLLPQN